MAKNSGGKTKAVLEKESKGQQKQKKLAKKEAKVMLAIEQGKASLEKAQRKLAKVQARIEARTAHVRDLVAQLTTMRAAPAETEAQASESGFDHQQGQTDSQELTASADAPAMSSVDGENHAGPAHTESKATSGSSTQKKGDSAAATPVEATAVEAKGATTRKEGSDTLPAKPRATSTKPPAPKTGATRRAPAKPSASSAPARRTITRRSAPKAKPASPDGKESV